MKLRGTLPLVVVLCAACGELQNAPFLPASVQGRLQGVDPSVAVVAVRGSAISAAPDVDGTFVLEQVPPGPATLFVVANSDAGTLLEVSVIGGSRNDVGVVQVGKPAWIDLDLAAPSAQRLDQAEVTVQGVPARVMPSTELGESTIGPLPAGCYHLTVRIPGFDLVDTDVCLAEGEDRDLSLQVPAPDGTVHIGCAVTGCLAGYECDLSTGRCEL